MKLSSLPNLICIARIVLAVPIVYTLVHGHYVSTLLLFFIAAVSDGLDGFLAKRYGWASETGKILDPVADKLLLVSAFTALTLLGLVPLWFAATAIARDLVIAGGAATYRALFGPLEGQPTWPSKLNTVLQLGFVLTVIADAGFPMVPDALLVGLGAAAFVTTVVSGLDYVLTYSRKAAQAASARRAAG